MPLKRIKISAVDYIIIPILLAGIMYIYFRVKTGLDYKWEWGAIPQFLFRFDPEKGKWVSGILMQGLCNTIRLGVWGIIAGALLGIIMGLFRVSKSLFKRLIGGTYVELIRNTPSIVIIFIFYFFFSSQIIPLLGLENFINAASHYSPGIISFLFGPAVMLPAFLSAIIALAVFEGAYITEIIRAGIESVAKEQWDTSYALGLSGYQQIRYIILPQAVRKILLPLAGQFISTLKDSAIVSVISIQELTFQGMELMASTYLTFEIWITVALMYLIMAISLSLIIGHIEKYLRKKANI